MAACGRWAALGLVLLLALLPAAARPADPFELNAILPLTGYGAFFGKGIATSFTLLEGVVNRTGGIRGRSLRINILDDQSSPQVSVQLLSGLMAKHVAVVMGSGLAGNCNAMAAIAKDGPVTYCFSPAVLPPPGSYQFCVFVASRDGMSALARFARAHHWEKIGFISANDAAGQAADRDFGELVAPADIAGREHLGTTDISAAAQIARIKAGGAQVLFNWANGTPAATVFRGAADAGLNIPMVTSTSNLTYEQMTAYAAFLPPQLYFFASPPFAPEVVPNGPIKRAVNVFLAAFKSAGIRPDQGEMLPWDATSLVVNALRKYGVDATATQIRDSIAGTESFDGIYGHFDFRSVPQRGLDASNLVIVRWDSARQQFVGASKMGGEPLDVAR